MPFSLFFAFVNYFSSNSFYLRLFFFLPLAALLNHTERERRGDDASATAFPNRATSPHRVMLPLPADPCRRLQPTPPKPVAACSPPPPGPAVATCRRLLLIPPCCAARVAAERSGVVRLSGGRRSPLIFCFLSQCWMLVIPLCVICRRLRLRQQLTTSTTISAGDPP